jgi:hypothetical protein
MPGLPQQYVGVVVVVNEAKLVPDDNTVGDLIEENV